jgi:hypothetical protein
MAFAVALGCVSWVVWRAPFAEARRIGALLAASAIGASVVAAVPLSDTPPVVHNMVHQSADVSPENDGT